jgi:hypothetical protein
MNGDFATENFCYLTTTGRRSGNPHTIEIWFGLDGERIFMLGRRAALGLGS